MREQEVIYCSWRDVNFARGVIRVSHKPEFNWTPKAYKEREIPLADKLAGSLKLWKKTAKDGLVFQTRDGGLKLDFLDCLKAVAERAGQEEEDFWLHKFRATFATRRLWNGVDLRTVQQWLWCAAIAGLPGNVLRRVAFAFG